MKHTPDTHHYRNGREVVICRIEKLKEPSGNILKSIKKSYGYGDFLISKSARDYIDSLETY